MSDGDISRYRREAEECRSFAAKTANAIEKQQALRLADEWLKLAQVARFPLGVEPRAALDGEIGRAELGVLPEHAGVNQHSC